MSRMADEELEALLRRCGEELKLRSEEIASGRRAPDVQKTMRDLSRWENESPKFWDRVREWLVPAELALACALLMLLTYSWRQRTGQMPAEFDTPPPSMIAEQDLLEDEDSGLASDDVTTAYVAWNESWHESNLSGDSDFESETDEQESSESLFPEYVSLSIELPDENYDEENVYDQENVFDS